MRVLVVTNMHPTQDNPVSGVFVADQVASLRRLGVSVDVLFVNGPKSKVNYLWGFVRLWKHLFKRYDLVHAHYVLSGLIARAQMRRPVVLTHHGHEVFGGGAAWEAWLSRRITGLFDEVVVVSEEMRQRMPYPKAHVIPCGISLDRFDLLPKHEARERLGLAQDKKYVLWTGEPSRPGKRFDLAEEAVRRLQAEDGSVELLLLWGKPHDAVPMYMNAADVLLMVSDSEGSPMVVKEAMACNLPVVARPVGDVAEVIGGTDGCHICTEDPADIAAKARIVLDRGKRTMGREAVRHLDIDVIARRVLDVYEQALSAKPGVRIDATSAGRSSEQELVKG